MSCKVILNGIEYSEEEFNKFISNNKSELLLNIADNSDMLEGFSDFIDNEVNIKTGVSDLFENNTELANQVYESLGFDNKQELEELKKKFSSFSNIRDRLKGNLKDINNLANVFTQIASDVNFYKPFATDISEQRKKDIISGKATTYIFEDNFDTYRKTIEKSLKDELELEADRYNYWFDDGVHFYTFDVESRKYYKYNSNASITPLEKKYEVSKKEYYEALDNYKDDLEQKNIQEQEDVKENVLRQPFLEGRMVRLFDNHFVIVTKHEIKEKGDSFINEIEFIYYDEFDYDRLKQLEKQQITSQQKQQAQQLYTQYLESLNKPNTNPILLGNQQEQVTKFTELQERLNNPEFIEGAKFAYENSEELQQLGTQEQYSKYLDAIFPDSKVKEIVYHGTNDKNFTPKTNRQGIHFGFKKYVEEWLFRTNAPFNQRYYNIKKELEDLEDNDYSETFNKTGKELREEYESLRNRKTYYFPAILNITNPKTTVYKAYNWEKDIIDAKKENKDGLVYPINKDVVNSNYLNGENQVVFEPEQIHILGSKQDIEGFKEFVNRLQFQKSTTQSDTNQSSINNQQIQYQKLGILRQDLIPEESAIRDLAARLADRIGGKVDFINEESEKYAGYNEGNKSTINLHYATEESAVHEILGHPIIRAIKNKKSKLRNYNVVKSKDGYKVILINKDGWRDIDNKQLEKVFNTREEANVYANSLHQNDTELYHNLLKELETGYGKEVLDRVKKEYISKNITLKLSLEEQANIRRGVHSSEDKKFNFNGVLYTTTNLGELRQFYTLEELQEEALVQLTSELVAQKIKDIPQNKNLISLLKQLLKEMTAYMRSLFNAKEIEIDKLRADMTLNDLANLLAYSNSKIILPGNSVEYTTPDNQKFATYQEASNHITELFKESKDVDVDNIKLLFDDITIKDVPLRFNYVDVDPDGNYPDTIYNIKYQNNKWYYRYKYEPTYIDDDISTYSDFEEITPEKVLTFYKLKLTTSGNKLKDFVEKNKEFEKARKIIEIWKKENNIIYNPEEVYSRGHQFISTMGAFGTVDVKLFIQNLLHHLDDYDKVGSKFELSFHTAPIDNRGIININQEGGKIYLVAYPKSEDIAWASKVDNYSGSVWEANEKFSNKPMEIAGVAHTKSPNLDKIDTIEPNLAEIIDERNPKRNELGIAVTTTNHRIEYDEDISYNLKKLIDNYNRLLDSKYGKLVKPKQIRGRENITKVDVLINRKVGNPLVDKSFDDIDEAEKYAIKQWGLKWITSGNIIIKKYFGIKPTQTHSNTTSIDSVVDKLDKINNIEKYQKELQEFESKKEKMLRFYDSSFDSEYYAESLEQAKTKNWWVEDYYEIEDITNEFNSIRNNEAVKMKQNLDNYISEYEELTGKKYTEFQKEYTEQALINTKITALKAVAKKYPRSLIISKVINHQTSERQYQKVNNQLTSTQKENIANLKQSDNRWQKYSDEDIQRFIDEKYPDNERQQKENTAVTNAFLTARQHIEAKRINSDKAISEMESFIRNKSFKLFTNEEYSKNPIKYLEEVERVVRLIENKLKIKERPFTGKTTNKFINRQDYLNDIFKQLLENIGLPDTITNLEELKQGLNDKSIIEYIQRQYDIYNQKSIKAKTDLDRLNSNVRVLNSFLKSQKIDEYSDRQQEKIKSSFPALFGELGRYKSVRQALAHYKQIVNTPTFLNKVVNLKNVKMKYFASQSKLNKFENLLNYNTLSPEDFQDRIYKAIENELDRRSAFFDSPKMQTVILAEKERIAKQNYEKSVKGILERFSNNDNSISGEISKVFLQHPNTLNAIKAENIKRSLFMFKGGEWKGDGTINVNYTDEQSLKHILLHELTHHFTVPYIITYLKNYSNADKYIGFSERFPTEEDLKEDIEYSVKELTPQEIESISKLEDIYIHILNLHKQGKIEFTNKEFSKNPEYGLENLYEFMSEVISNPYFAAEIAKQPSLFNRKSNLLKDIIDSIFKMFGINDNSLLDDVYSLFEDSFLNKDEKYNFKSLLESKSSFKYNSNQTIPNTKKEAIIEEIKKLPIEIYNTIELVDEVPSNIIGNKNIFLSIKPMLAERGITDPLLINWVGINKNSIGNIKSISSEQGLIDMIQSSYNKKLKKDDIVFKINSTASDSFDEWVEALDNYPIVFKDIMLKHALKYINNPDRKDKYVLQLSKVALSNAYNILIAKPHEANRLGTLYNKEAVKVIFGTLKSEPSSSGKGYWGHISKTMSEETIEEKVRGLNKKIKKEQGKLKNIGISESGAFDNILKSINDDIANYKKEIELLLKSDTSQYDVNVSMLRRLSPASWCTASYASENYVELYDNYLLVVNGKTVAGIESTGELQSNGKIKVISVTNMYNTEINDIHVASIDHIDDIIAFFEKHNLDTDNPSINLALKLREQNITDKEVSGLTIDEDEEYPEIVSEDPLDAFLEAAYEEYGIEFTTPENFLSLSLDTRKRIYNLPENTMLQEAFTLDTEEDKIDLKTILKEYVRYNQLGIQKIEIYDTNSIDYNDLLKIAMRYNPSVYYYLNFEAKSNPIAINAFNIYKKEIEPYMNDKELYSQGLYRKEDGTVDIVDEEEIDSDDLEFSKTNDNLIQGYYDPNTDKVVVVVANTPINEAAKISIHEIAHRGMIRLAKDLGGMGELANILYSAEEQLMQKLPELLNRTGHTDLESLLLDYGYSIDNKEGKVKLLMELAARWAETFVDKPHASWWKELIEDIKQWINRYTGVTLNEKEVNELVAGIVRYGVKTNNNTFNQRNSEGRIIGQARLNPRNAMEILLDENYINPEVVAHEYAHYYINMFIDTPIVIEAIRKWGNVENLVQAIGEQAVRQEGDAWNWWTEFINWIKDKINNLSDLDKKELAKILTDAFLEGEDLNKVDYGLNFEDIDDGIDEDMPNYTTIPINQYTYRYYPESDMIYQIFKSGVITDITDKDNIDPNKVRVEYAKRNRDKYIFIKDIKTPEYEYVKFNGKILSLQSYKEVSRPDIVELFKGKNKNSTVNNDTANKKYSYTFKQDTSGNGTVDTDFELSDEQKELMEKLYTAYFNSERKGSKDPMDNIFLIEGSAGTGKSSTVKYFLTYLANLKKINGDEIAMSTPTHKANEVLYSFVRTMKNKRGQNIITNTRYDYDKQVFTTQAMLGVKIDYSQRGSIGDKEPNEMPKNMYSKFERPLKKIWIVDEISMLDNYKGIDIKEVFKYYADKGIYVILMGDSKQLESVNTKKESPLFRWIPDNAPNKAVLSVEQRQTTDNPIINTLKTVVKQINSKNYSNPLIVKEGVTINDRGIYYTNNDREQLDLFLSEEYEEDRTFVKIIARSNKKVDMYNTMVRNYKYGSPSLYEIGDTLMGYSQLKDGSAVQNGKEYIVQKIEYDVPFNVYSYLYEKYSRENKRVMLDVLLRYKENLFKTIYLSKLLMMPDNPLFAEDEPFDTYIAKLDSRERLDDIDAYLTTVQKVTKDISNLYAKKKSLGKDESSAKRAIQNEINLLNDLVIDIAGSIQIQDNLYKIPETNKVVTEKDIDVWIDKKYPNLEFDKKEEKKAVRIHQEKTIDYGYAITVTKSQGSTYQHVIGDLESIEGKNDWWYSKNNQESTRRSTLKSLYVLLSRASHNLYLYTLDSYINSTKNSIDDTDVINKIKNNKAKEDNINCTIDGKLS